MLFLLLFSFALAPSISINAGNPNASSVLISIVDPSAEHLDMLLLDPVANAGSDQEICAGQAAYLFGNVQNCISVTWSGGDGIFSAPGNLVTNYIPGTGDILAGVVELCLTAEPIDPNAVAVIDCLSLVIRELPSASAGDDITICEMQACATNPLLTNCSQTYWISFGDGYFEDETMAVTNYYPGQSDHLNGQVDLWLLAEGVTPCFVLLADSMKLYLDVMPASSAGDDATICEDETAQLTGIAEYYTNLLWITTGTGTFNDANILDPTYTPSEEDVAAGTIEICLLSTKTGACDFVVAEDCLLLTIIAKPTISGLVAERTLDCGDFDLVNHVFRPLVFSPIVENESSLLWTTSGDGTFEDPTIENPVYQPGINDIWNGGFTVNVVANGFGSCSFTTQAYVNIIVPIQIIPFENSGWTGLSSYVDKQNATVPEVIAPVIDELIVLLMLYENIGKYYWPVSDPPINQLGNWQPIGYKAKVKSPCCLPIYGDPVTVQTFLIDATMTYLPVLTNVQVSIEDLLGVNAPKVLLIFDWSTGKVWTNTAGDFHFLVPGRAYLMVKKANSDPFTVTFPAVDFNVAIDGGGVAVRDLVVTNSPWNVVTNTSQSHIILFTDKARRILQSGDIIGAFNEDGLCVGVSTCKSDESLHKLIVMGIDHFTNEITGYEVGDKMYFRLYRPETGITYDITFIYDPNFPNFDGNFQVNGVSSVINAKMTITAITNLNNNLGLKIFPNPANEVINITSGQNLRNIKLINLTGQLVIDYVVTGNEQQIDVSQYVQGLYFLQIESTGGDITTQRIVIK